jgi:type II secretory pathway pseudopilin PulG
VIVLSVVIVGGYATAYGISYTKDKRAKEQAAVQAQEAQKLKEEQAAQEQSQPAPQAAPAPTYSPPAYTPPPLPDNALNTANVPNSVTPPPPTHCSTYVDAMGIAQTDCY